MLMKISKFAMTNLYLTATFSHVLSLHLCFTKQMFTENYLVAFL